MAKGLEVDLSGVRELQRKLDETSDRSLDLRRPLREAADDLRDHAEKMWQTRGRAGGEAWPSLSPYTQRARARGWGFYRNNPAKGMLNAKGSLKGSYTDRTHRDHVEDIDRGGMEWGSNHNLAHLHAQGPQNRGPAPPLPSRPVIAFSTDREKLEIFRDPILKHVTAPFKGE